MSRRRRRLGFEAHVRLYKHELESAAYRSLSPDARALLVEFRALFNGRENRIFMSVRDIRQRLGGIGQGRAIRARDQLLDRGFIRLLAQGSFTYKIKHASEYALTNEPLTYNDGAVAPKDFMKWAPIQNAVLNADPYGTRSEYRGIPNTPQKAALGTRPEYRKRQISPPLGTHPEYTDSLPGGARNNTSDKSMARAPFPCDQERA